MSSDPRHLKCGIAGPGGPHDRKQVVLNAENAVLLGGVDVCQVETTRGGPDCLAMLLSGRVNRSPDLVDVLFLLDVDGAAAIVTELLALAGRMGADELAAEIRHRIQELAGENVLGMELEEAIPDPCPERHYDRDYDGDWCDEQCRQYADHEGDHECVAGRSWPRTTPPTPRRVRWVTPWEEVQQ